MKDVSKFFKAYDLRGTTPELSFEVYYLAGQGLITEILEVEALPKKVVVWHDTRLSSPEFYSYFISGLVSMGCEVIPCGLGTTDMMYASAMVEGCCGAIITASHNPKDDNGLKIVKKVPQMLGLSTGLDKIRDYVVNSMAKGDLVDRKCLIDFDENTSARENAIEFLEGKILELSSPLSQKLKLKVVVDSGNGMGGLAILSLIKCFPNVTFIPLFCDLDGNFPNHPADPINPENLIDLSKKVLEEKADFGIAFDGDADRAFFVDENGTPLNGENLVAVFAREMVKTAQTDSVVKSLGLTDSICYVVSYSRALPDIVSMSGGVPIVCKQGHTFVKAKMNEYKSIYGGEASGHHYFGQFGFLDSGVLAVGLLFRILSEKENLKVSKLTEFFENKYFTLGETNKKMKDGMTIGIVKEKIKNTYSDAFISELDGVTVYYPDYKFTIRGSNTEPVLRINIESRKSKEQVSSIFNDLIKLLDL
jgi:phosphomannomutase